MPYGGNRREPKIPSWVGYIGDMKKPQEMLAGKSWLSGWLPIKFLNSFFRSLGAVAFANNPLTGFLIFLGMCVGNIEVGLAGLLAGFMGFLTCKMLSVNNVAVCLGVPMFNSILVGAISAAVTPTVFHTPLSAAIWCGIALAAVLTVFVDQGLNSMMGPSNLPGQSVPFNLVVAVFMAIINAHCQSPENSGIVMKQIGNITNDINLLTGDGSSSTGNILMTSNTTSNMEIDWSQVWQGVLLSTGQVYGVGTPTPSVFIWLAFAICSPILFLLMACGAVIGSVSGALLAPLALQEVYQGLWGYNSLLAAGGMVFFNVPSPVAVIAAFVNAFVAVCIQVAILPLFAPTNMPVFSYPFNVAIMLILAISLRKESPLIMVTDLSFPELHLYRCYKDLDREDVLPEIEANLPLNGPGINTQK